MEIHHNLPIANFAVDSPREGNERATPRGEMIFVSDAVLTFCFVHIVTWNVVANKPFKTSDVQEEVCIQMYLFTLKAEG